MSYLQDKKTRRKKIIYIVFFLIIFFILFYFRISIFNGLSYVGHKVFRPVLVAGNNISEKFGGISSYFASKKSLYLENENLKNKINENVARISGYDSTLAENLYLKDILGRTSEVMDMTLALILSKPNKSPYDTLIIDAGLKQGLEVGDMVFAMGNVPIGGLSEVYESSSKVTLFSSPREKTQAVISMSNNKDIFVELVGRGGGNFEIIILQGLNLSVGDQAVLPSIRPYVLGTVETIISDPRESFTKALLVSPVNIQEIKFVQVES